MWVVIEDQGPCLLNLEKVIQIFCEGRVIHFQLSLDGDERYQTFFSAKEAQESFAKLCVALEVKRGRVW